MKRLLLILLVPIVAVQVQGASRTVTSLPYTLPAHSADTWDTLWIGDQDTTTTTKITWNPPTAAREGIVFSSVSYWRVLFANDTIVWGGDPTCVQSRVIRIQGTSHHIEIKGVSTAKRGYILYSNPYFGDTLVDTLYNLTRATITLPRDTAVRANPQAIYGGGSYGVIRNMYIRVGGFGYDDGDAYLGSSCINLTFGGVMNEIDHNTLVNQSVMFYGRDNYPARCLRISATTALTGSDTMNVYVHDNTITTNGTQCIATLGVGKYLIFDNTMTIDGRNAMEDAGSTNEMWCWTHAFCLVMNRPGRGSRIHGNTVRSGTAYRGGQGMFFVANDTSTTHTGWVTVDSNDVSVHGGNSSFYSYYQNMGSALKIRAHLKNIRVFGNQLTYTCDTTKWRATGNSGPAYMPIGAAIEYQFYSNYVSGAYNTEVYNNVCSTNVITDLNTSYYMVCGIRFSGVDFNPEDTTFKWYGNTFKGRMNWAYTFGTNAGVDEPPAFVRGVRVRNDTVTMTAWNSYTMALANSAARGTYTSTNNVVQDVVLSGVSDAECTYYGNGTSGMYLTTGINNQYRQRTLTLRAQDGTGLPIENAVVTVRNAYNQTVATDTTNASGLCYPLVSYSWYSVNQADSLGYNQFTFIATKGADADTSALNVAWNAYTDTLVLAASTGTPTSVGQGITERGNVRVSGNVVIGKP